MIRVGSSEPTGEETLRRSRPPPCTTITARLRRRSPWSALPTTTSRQENGCRPAEPAPEPRASAPSPPFATRSRSSSHDRSESAKTRVVVSASGQQAGGEAPPRVGATQETGQATWGPYPAPWVLRAWPAAGNYSAISMGAPSFLQIVSNARSHRSRRPARQLQVKTQITPAKAAAMRRSANWFSATSVANLIREEKRSGREGPRGEASVSVNVVAGRQPTPLSQGRRGCRRRASWQRRRS